MAGTGSPDPDATALLSEAGAALGRRAWPEAQVLFERALALGESPEALEGFAFASWWRDDVDAAIAARERAYVLRRERDETVEAARVAGFLAWDYGAMRGVNAVANGWLQRARRLLEGRPPSAELAWLPLIEASFHLDTDPAAVLRLSTEAAEHARAHGGLDIEMTARTLQGLALVSLGRVDEGTRLLDEGTAAATAGELYDPIAIGSCCCNMIIACERSRDFDRAGQWCEQLAAFCERTGHAPLLALCRAHHGTVRMMRGEWEEAEQDLDWAADALTILRPPLAGYARARLAQLRRRQGRPREARALVEQAGAHVLAPLVNAELASTRTTRRARSAMPTVTCGGSEAGNRSRARRRSSCSFRSGSGSAAWPRPATPMPSWTPSPPRCGPTSCARPSAWRPVASRWPSVTTMPARAALEDAVDLFLRCGTPFEAAQARLELARALTGQERAAAGAGPGAGGARGLRAARCRARSPAGGRARREARRAQQRGRASRDDQTRGRGPRARRRGVVEPCDR